MDKDLAHLINGQWRKGNSTEAITVVDPATEETIATLSSASATDTQDAIAAAEAALRSWRATQAWTRADILHTCADVMTARLEEAARQITLEAGSPSLRRGASGSSPSTSSAGTRKRPAAFTGASSKAVPLGAASKSIMSRLAWWLPSRRGTSRPS